ncbi:MAG: HNH endonuclease, partial [Paramuribaculum sp.]|nr:HNH endonuclease [Paramuribaculum sp.]
MKNFTFAMKWHEILKPYSEDIRREVYDAVIEYATSGNIIEMQPLARMAFDFIRYEIDEKARRR